MSVTREQVVAAARRYMDVPWVHQGRSMLGVDCIGLHVCPARDLGTTAFDITDYGILADGYRLRRVLQEQCGAPHPIARMRPADIILMRFRLLPHHIAMATNTGMLHSSASVGRVVETSINRRLRSMMIEAYRFPGVED